MTTEKKVCKNCRHCRKVSKGEYNGDAYKHRCNESDRIIYNKELSTKTCGYYRYRGCYECIFQHAMRSSAVFCKLCNNAEHSGYVKNNKKNQRKRRELFFSTLDKLHEKKSLKGLTPKGGKI